MIRLALCALVCGAIAAGACAPPTTLAPMEPIPFPASGCTTECLVEILNKGSKPLDIAYHSSISAPQPLGAVYPFRVERFLVTSTAVPMVVARSREDGTRVSCARARGRTSVGGVVRIECGGRR